MLPSFQQATVQVTGLRGRGLTLAVSGTPLAVPASGVFTVPLPTALAALDVVVTQAPVAPSQRCDVSKLEGDVFSVVCADRSWPVGGLLAGYDGKGLELGLFDPDDIDGLPQSVASVVASGTFSFPDPLVDGARYEVRVLAPPTQPRQDCVVENAEGVATAAVTNVKVVCTTKQYLLTSVVTGLRGKGLTLQTSIGTFAIDAPGMTTYADRPLPDGTRYEVAVASQPKDPEQFCRVEAGSGLIDGANATVTILCGAANNLRVSEVGACPYSASACWFEIHNAGAQADNLGFYTLRTSALAPTMFEPSRTFALPDVGIPVNGRVVVQARTETTLKDGQGVYHVSDGETAPWWSDDGFVELLDPSGATADFVRWGYSDAEPTTAGFWAGGSCPALPRGAGAYGRSLQQKPGGGALPRSPADFVLRAFATYGGINDVDSDVDDDADGIPDTAEAQGATFSGLDLYAMGARPNQRDVFVEVDYMAGSDPATRPRKEALDAVVAAFQRRGIAVHFDAGELFSPGFSPALYNLGGGNEVPFATAVGIGPIDSEIVDLYDVKAAHMAGNRRMTFYYQLFGSSQLKSGKAGSSGVGEMPGNDSLITLGGIGLNTNNALQRNVLANYQAATVMHELGHNFGLRHGGDDSINRKPNYVSVMNYLYSPLGLPTIGNAEGDRYDLYKKCTLIALSQLTNAPTGDTTKFVLDFSTGSSTNLDESALLEGRGLGRVGSTAVDFNCNRKTDGAPYSQDLNSDGELGLLTDHDDWNALDFVFRRLAPGAESGPTLRYFQEHEDILTDDTTHRTDEPCPAPFVEAPR